jgi:hypothetical protein
MGQYEENRKMLLVVLSLIATLQALVSMMMVKFGATELG